MPCFQRNDGPPTDHPRRQGSHPSLLSQIGCSAVSGTPLGLETTSFIATALPQVFGVAAAPEGTPTAWAPDPYLGGVGQDLLHVLGDRDGARRLDFVHEMPQHRGHRVVSYRLFPGAEGFPSPKTWNDCEKHTCNGTIKNLSLHMRSRVSAFQTAS